MTLDRRESEEQTDPATGMRWLPRVPLFEDSDDGKGPLAFAGPKTSGGNDEGDGERVVSRDAEDLLIRAKRKPYLALTELYQNAGLSAYKGSKSRVELIRAGFAGEVELPSKRRGRRKKLLQVTPRGNEYLRALGVYVASKGRGGVKHLYYQKEIKEWYESRGFTAEIEARVGETTFDVLAIRDDGDRVGVEIALSSPYERTNAEKAVMSRVETVIFVCETDEMRQKLTDMLGDIGDRCDKAPRFSVKLVDEYLR